MDILNNQWVIGIGTSVISGLLVFLFTRKFFTDKQKREYNQKIRTANNEILYAIRPLIVEKTKPQIETLNSIFYSTARKYSVKLSDIYDKETLCDDLTNEIMSNSFLSPEQKIKLTEMITELKNENTDEIKKKIVTIYREDRSNSSMYISILLSIMTATTAIVFTYFFSLKDGELFNSSSGKISDSISFFLMIIIIPAMAIGLTTVLKYLRDKEKDNEQIKHKKTLSSEKNKHNTASEKNDN